MPCVGFPCKVVPFITDMSTSYSDIQNLLGADAQGLLGFSNPKIKKEQIHLPRAD